MTRVSKIVATAAAALLAAGLSATVLAADPSNTAGGAVGCCRWTRWGGS